MDVLQRSFSGAGNLQRARSSTRMNSLGAVAEHASTPGIMKLFTDPGAASASFDDICEVLGDVAKLDNVGSTLSASLGAAGTAATSSALKGILNNNAALSWIVEKVTQNLHEFSLLEAWVDKTLLDLFQQLYQVLDLDGTVFDMPCVRLMVAAAVAVVVRQLVVQYKQQHPTQLERQLSPAASLTDVLAETAAATIIASTVSGDKEQQLQPALAAAVAMPGSTAAIASSSSSGGSSSSSMPTSSFKELSASLLRQQELGPMQKARVAAHSLAVNMLLGQFKRANKLKRKAKVTLSEVSQGHWSPGLLLVLLEAAVYAHNYGEMASGLSALLHLSGAS